jgi:putative phosphoribosyl transferase
MRFTDRRQAGQILGELLRPQADHDRVVVGLPRGGVVVADEVAKALSAPLDVIVVRKLGVPGHGELAMGAVGEDGVCSLNSNVLRQVEVSDSVLADIERRERARVEERTQRLRGSRSRIDLSGRRVLVVDDGIATGATARAACEVARLHGATWITLGVPVAPRGWKAQFRDVTDELVGVESPDRFGSVGQWYDDFRPVSDDDVARILTAAQGDQ